MSEYEKVFKQVEDLKRLSEQLEKESLRPFEKRGEQYHRKLQKIQPKQSENNTEYRS